VARYEALYVEGLASAPRSRLSSSAVPR
jgi:hypothetical protein